MRKILWKVIVLIIMLMMSGSFAFSKGLGGWLNMTNNTSKIEEDGEKASSLTSFNRNLNLRLNRPVTPILSYNIYLKADLTDSESTNYTGNVTTRTFRRTLGPTMEFFLRNNIYDLNAGYRRHEQWSTAHYSNSSRLTSEFYYSRLGITPKKLPSFLIDLDRQKNFDHIAERATDSTTNSYKISSSYNLPSRDMKFGYDIAFSRDKDETPLSRTAKSVNTAFSNNYNIGYTGSLMERKVNYSVGYQGNFSRNSTKRYNTAAGSDIFERTENGGFSAESSDRQAMMTSNSLLTNGNLTTSAGVDLTSDSFNHIGIQILFGESVDRLYIYVDEDLTGEAILDNINNWQAFRNDDNGDSGWTEVDIASVNVVSYDVLNSKYRYEIIFSDPEQALYFKAINLNTSNITGVDVTEIEAYGTDEITIEGISATVSKSFNQGLTLNAGFRPAAKWNFGLNYSVDRADQRPVSVTDSMSGLFENIFSKSMDNENALSTSNVSRNYSASARWLAHDLLNTTMNINRNESFNNIGESDRHSNAYNFSFYYIPIPTVDTRLSVVRSESYSFDVKNSVSDSLLLSADTRLYRDVNMVTDIVYSQSKSIASATTTSSRSINGSLDSVIKRNLTGTLNYGYGSTSSTGNSSISKDLSTALNYRPGRFINLTGDFGYSRSGGTTDISETFRVDWLPLPRIRLNITYNHSDSDPGPSTTDSINSYATWYITKIATVRFSYGYTRNMTESEQESYNFNTNLNCRF